jgi:hypothetical protein
LPTLAGGFLRCALGGEGGNISVRRGRNQASSAGCSTDEIPRRRAVPASYSSGWAKVSELLGEMARHKENDGAYYWYILQNAIEDAMMHLFSSLFNRLA